MTTKEKDRNSARAVQLSNKKNIYIKYITICGTLQSGDPTGIISKICLLPYTIAGVDFDEEYLSNIEEIEHTLKKTLDPDRIPSCAASVFRGRTYCCLDSVLPSVVKVQLS
jgi:hypothetical protein